MRIEAKRLRYAVDALGSLFDSRATGRYHDALAELQDVLGAANDAASAARLIAQIDPPPAFLRAARRHFDARSRAGAQRLERLLARLARRGPPAPRASARR